MLRLVTVCCPAKAFNFYSGYPDLCTAVIIIIMVQLISCRRCFLSERTIYDKSSSAKVIGEIEDNNNSNSNNTTLIVLFRDNETNNLNGI